MSTRPMAGTLMLAALLSGGLAAQQPNELTNREKDAGWTLVFDGKTTAGWRGYGASTLPSGWEVVDGALTRVGPAGDIVTADSYRSFELSLEWKISSGGNSGVFYRAIEAADPKARPIFYSAPEMQVLDDERHADGKSPLTSAGSVYGLYPAPRGVVRPVGDWNEARIVVRGQRVEHWLNGIKCASYELGGTDWLDRVHKSKFTEWPEYGTAVEGRIGLQDHGDWVAYRNIKLRRLPPL